MPKVEFRIISRKSKAVLVEFEKEGRLERVTVPSDEDIDEEILSAGIPYGLRFESPESCITLAEVVESMHRKGVWTREQILSNPQVVRDAAVAAAGQLVREIFSLARTGGK